MDTEEQKLKLKTLEEKHKSLFDTELKNIYFPQTEKERLIVFVDQCIESLFFLYLMWSTHERLDPILFKGMTKRSVWFFIHGMLLQTFVARAWEPELASVVAESIVVYIVSQAFDLFSIRTGRVKVH